MSRSWLLKRRTASTTFRPIDLENTPTLNFSLVQPEVKIPSVLIQPVKRIRGTVMLPGDKSISQRAAILAALAKGTSRLQNYSTSADCDSTLSCLQQLGVDLERSGNAVLVNGVGLDGLRAPAAALDCGNSGTTMRLLAGILAGQSFNSIMTGDESLRARPMQRVVEPLSMMGANISSQDGRAPLVISGRHPLQAIEYELLIASAQVKSCILLAGLYAEGRTEVIEKETTRDHTERLLRWFGVHVETGAAERAGLDARFAAVRRPAQLQAHDVSIPGDISSAAYLIAAAALLPESSLEIRDVGVNPTRIQFVNQLQAMGLDVSVADSSEESNEPVGTVRVRGLDGSRSVESSDTPIMINGSLVPQLIDELPLLAVVGTQLDGGLEIRDAAELRLKESDRIATTVQNLRAMGAVVEEFDDGLRVTGPALLRGARVDPRGDHRIVMAFAVAALLAEGETDIENAGCVAISFPEFFELLASVVER
jgi:3-phosphoshikimate 1-carboxyvinyltransferase